MARTGHMTCQYDECGYEWNLRETPAGAMVQHIDRNTGQETGYSQCPKCKRRWQGNKLTRDDLRIKATGWSPPK